MMKESEKAAATASAALLAYTHNHSIREKCKEKELHEDQKVVSFAFKRWRIG